MSPWLHGLQAARQIILPVGAAQRGVIGARDIVAVAACPPAAAQPVRLRGERS